LPVVLDVGTDNHLLFSGEQIALRCITWHLNLGADPLYMGWKHTRVRGEPYNRFVDKFVKHISALFPDALIHFEE
jgi:malate dehydrogenase (oxaloacetate-decarboxylating)